MIAVLAAVIIVIEVASFINLQAPIAGRFPITSGGSIPLYIAEAGKIGECTSTDDCMGKAMVVCNSEQYNYKAVEVLQVEPVFMFACVPE